LGHGVLAFPRFYHGSWPNDFISQWQGGPDVCDGLVETATYPPQIVATGGSVVIAKRTDWGPRRFCASGDTVYEAGNSKCATARFFRVTIVGFGDETRALDG
jgi:hypothetical protein